MSSDTTLQALVERYLDERHRLGFSARTQAYALRSFARHVHALRLPQQDAAYNEGMPQVMDARGMVSTAIAPA